MYCSRDCQVKSWPDHKKACNTFKYSFEDYRTDFIQWLYDNNNYLIMLGASVCMATTLVEQVVLITYRYHPTRAIKVEIVDEVPAYTPLASLPSPIIKGKFDAGIRDRAPETIHMVNLTFIAKGDNIQPGAFPVQLVYNSHDIDRVHLTRTAAGWVQAINTNAAKETRGINVTCERIGGLVL